MNSESRMLTSENCLLSNGNTHQYGKEKKLDTKCALYDLSFSTQTFQNIYLTQHERPALDGYDFLFCLRLSVLYKLIDSRYKSFL